MPETPPPEPEFSIPNDRYYVQLALGQVHGVLHRAVVDAGIWLRSTEPSDAPLTAADLLAAYGEACHQIGAIQAGLNTGACDEALAGRGFSGAQLKAKLKGFWQAVKRYATANTQNIVDYLAQMQSTLGWCGSIVGSVTTALEAEIKKIPGGAAAAEGLKEFIELLQNAAESPSEKRIPPSPISKKEPGVD